jgi:hypothetical protein
MASLNPVEDVLRRRGPCESSRIAEAMSQRGVAKATARKRISRAKPPVRRLLDIRLPRNEAFLYLDEQFKSERFWHNLLRALDDSRSVYGLAVRSLEARGGCVPKRLFPTVSGSPYRLVGHLSYEAVLSRLLKIELLEERFDPGVGDCIALNENAQIETAPGNSLYARRIAEEALIIATKEWLRRLGLASYDKVNIRQDPGATPPRVGQFHWDITAPVYASPFVTPRKTGAPLPGFFAADVILGRQLGESDIRYFLHKSLAHRSQKQQRPLMTMLLAEWFSREALRLGKSRGLLLCTPASLFGEDVADALRQLIGTLQNAAAAAAKNPETLLDLFSRLGRVEGLASSLRGPFFEMIVGHAVRERDGHTIDIRKVIEDPNTGNIAEIDVFRVKGRQETWCYECKGKEPGGVVELNDVEDWFSRQIPRMRGWISAESRFAGSQVGFEFWTTGTFSKDAAAYLARQRPKKFKLAWKDGKAVRAYIAAAKLRPIVRFLDDYYLKKPLSKN